MDFVMRRQRSAVLALCVIATLASAIGLPGSQVALAQGSNSYEFGAGQELAWSGGWEIDEESTFVEGQVEMAALLHDSAGLIVISLPDGTDMNEARDIFLDAFLDGRDAQVIDRGDYDNVSYSLDTFDIDGTTLGVFTLFRVGSGGDPTFAYIMFADIQIFADRIEDAQQSVTLDGTALFPGVDGQGLEDQLSADVGESNSQPDDEQSTPDDGDSAAEPTTTPGSGGKLGGRNDDDESTPDATEEANVLSKEPFSDAVTMSSRDGTAINWSRE
jgi:hypothetical protein